MIRLYLDFCKKHDLRVFQTGYLGYMHFVAIFAIAYLVINYHLIPKYIIMHCIVTSFYGLGITGGVHRLWAHKSYEASTPLRIFLMLMNSGMNQGSIFHWSRDHRLHHKFSDTPFDPHNIHKGFFFSHVGWLLKKKSPQLVKAGRQIDMSDLKNDPIVMFQKKYYLYLSMTMCFVIPTIMNLFIFQISIIPAFILSILSYTLLLNQTWCVNSLCHMFGTRPYNDKIQPRQNYFVSLITNGQGYHNWHHEYPFDWRGSKDQWYQINLTARFIQTCSFLGLAKVKKV